jgi:hypothetical protein
MSSREITQAIMRMYISCQDHVRLSDSKPLVSLSWAVDPRLRSTYMRPETTTSLAAALVNSVASDASVPA